MSVKDMPLFKASEDCQKHDELLQYTSFDSLTKIVSSRTILCNSLGRVNDRLEQSRKGIEDLTQGFYVSCFCHYPYEIVPFWFMYGGNKNEEKALLRFRNFASKLDNAIESDWAWTSENKLIYFDLQKLFFYNRGGVSCNPICDPNVEQRQTIKAIRMFDIDYKLPDDEVFTKEYAKPGNVSFDNGESYIPTSLLDVRNVGMQKTVHWEYEAETRLKCMMSTINAPYFDFLLLRLKDEVFRGLEIVANPWATDDFLQRIKDLVDASTLSEDIKGSMKIVRSKLDGQIVPMD